MDRVKQAEQLMDAFAERTGLAGASAARRYLWTDAFAVCNYLSLHQTRGDDAFLERAAQLVNQVHEVLGAYAENDARSGWLGGMNDVEHARAPTRAGLRIGKQSPERGPNEAFDEREEWDRDGQYFHYLTRWMHALERMAETTGEARYHRWAFDLAIAAFDGFVHRPAGDESPRMYWKMSVDLDRPLVPSMGHHDPLDGWVTARMLGASSHADDGERHALETRAATYLEMLAGRDLATGDALGIGGLLVDAWQLFRILPAAKDVAPDRVAELLEAAGLGLAHVVRQRQLEAAPARRLAFRELGLSTGLRVVGRMVGEVSSWIDDQGARARLEASLARLSDRLDLVDRIESTWIRPENREFPAWTDHRDINEVMLATTLAPAGYLGPVPHGESHKENSS